MFSNQPADVEVEGWYSSMTPLIGFLCCLGLISSVEGLYDAMTALHDKVIWK
jgi:hypothetical protein